MKTIIFRFRKIETRTTLATVTIKTDGKTFNQCKADAFKQLTATCQFDKNKIAFTSDVNINDF